nr:hypothetical protein [Glaciecola nitratireducens]
MNQSKLGWKEQTSTYTFRKETAETKHLAIYINDWPMQYWVDTTS